MLLLSMAVGAAAAPSSPGCEEQGMNMQCSSFGSIKMKNQVDVRGEPVLIESTTTVSRTFAENGARWIMFAVRHEPESGSSPVSISLKDFSSAHGPIFTSRVDHEIPNELNVWVHVVDVPKDTPITMRVEVGVADRGAFKLETLVMPFDRGYEPLRVGGEEQTLYAATLLGVNKETAAVDGEGGGGGGFGRQLRTPGLAALPAALALVAVAAWTARRRDA